MDENIPFYRFEVHAEPLCFDISPSRLFIGYSLFTLTVFQRLRARFVSIISMGYHPNMTMKKKKFGEYERRNFLIIHNILCNTILALGER